MLKLNQQATKLQKETEENKKEFTFKFEELEARLDKVRYHKHIQTQQYQEIHQNNNMMYFFPIKVQE